MNLSKFFPKSTTTVVLILTFFGMLLHFYNLNWGAPFYFHPDERNIASSVSQLQFPSQMNPHFFAYGSLPIYVIHFTGVLTNFVTHLLNNTLTPNLNPSFDQAIQISRFYSAFFATLLIPLLFLIGKKLKNETVGLIAAFLATTSVGFIQFAHFGTFEMWLTFFTVLLFWTCIQPLTKKTILLMGTFFGILVATKISSLALFPLIFLVLFLQNTRKTQTTRTIRLSDFLRIRRSNLLSILSFLKNIIFIFIVSFIVYYLTNPFVLSDNLSFQNSMNYESGLALGKFPVFYTGEFYGSIPALFQFTNIYPFLLNPLITILFIPSFFYLLWKVFKTKSFSLMILASFFMILFFPQALLFAKWTRYMIPTLPFIYLIIGVAIVDLLTQKRQQWNSLTIATITLICTLFSFSYFITAFVRPDTRIEAYYFAQKNIPTNAPITSEVYDLGVMPFNQSFSMISLFNFYELDPTSPVGLRGANNLSPELLQHLENADYIILPSQRILKTRILQKEKFPQGNAFYQELISGRLGYQKIYETPCDLFCNITYLGNPVYRFEQTANVFDRPTVMIFKKNK